MVGLRLGHQFVRGHRRRRSRWMIGSPATAPRMLWTRRRQARVCRRTRAMLALLLAPRALRRAIAVSAVVWVALGAATAAGADRQLTVMTYNIYQGTEFRHFAALTGTTPSLDVALAATTADYETYLATRFPDRAAQIAAAIANEQPDLVGLQEVATWHRGAFDPSHPFALPGAVNEDFTRELLAALAARGAHYAAVARHDN